MPLVPSPLRPLYVTNRLASGCTNRFRSFVPLIVIWVVCTGACTLAACQHLPPPRTVSRCGDVFTADRSAGQYEWGAARGCWTLLPHAFPTFIQNPSNTRIAASGVRRILQGRHSSQRRSRPESVVWHRLTLREV